LLFDDGSRRRASWSRNHHATAGGFDAVLFLQVISQRLGLEQGQPHDLIAQLCNRRIKLAHRTHPFKQNKLWVKTLQQVDVSLVVLTVPCTSVHGPYWRSGRLVGQGLYLACNLATGALQNGRQLG